MVAWGAGAAGPVLLACRQWHPLGLVRRLPSRRAGAWHCVPLLPWQVQCCGRVCAALAAGLGVWGRSWVPRLSRAPPPLPPRSPCCVWLVVSSGCPLSLRAGTPFHVVCAFCGLGPVAPQVRPTCPLRVCASALPQCPPPSPLPGPVWRAHLAWFRCRALAGPFHAVRATPRFLPQSRAPSS